MKKAIALFVVLLLVFIVSVDALKAPVKNTQNNQIVQNKLQKIFSSVGSNSKVGSNNTFLFSYSNGEVLFSGTYNSLNHTMNGQIYFVSNTSIRADVAGTYTPYNGVPRYPGQMTIRVTNPYIINDTGWLGQGLFNSNSWTLWWVQDRNVSVSGITIIAPQ